MSGLDWYHEVDPQWLAARADALTATDIKGLTATWKRVKKSSAKGLIPEFAAVWGAKTADWPVDETSYGAAARGHIMEPYAVEEYNNLNNTEFHHWDDCIIVNGPVGFSPDALDIMQPTADIRLDYSDDGLVAFDDKVCDLPKHMLEIKSFEPAAHMKAIATPKMKRDQLMQLAVAFVVLPSLETATLVFFCPGAKIKLWSDTYTREDLQEYIQLAVEISEKYQETSTICEKLAASNGTGKTINLHECDVWRDHIATRQQNSFLR